MKIYIIAFFGPDGTFHHAIADTDVHMQSKHFELLKQTRNPEKIPEMKMYEAELGLPIAEHLKLPRVR